MTGICRRRDFLILQVTTVIGLNDVFAWIRRFSRNAARIIISCQRHQWRSLSHFVSLCFREYAFIRNTLRIKPVLFDVARLCGPHCRRRCKFSPDRYETSPQPLHRCMNAKSLRFYKFVILQSTNTDLFRRHETLISV